MKKLLCLLIFLTSCATYEKYARYLDGFIGIDKVGLIEIGRASCRERV